MVPVAGPVPTSRDVSLEAAVAENCSNTIFMRDVYMKSDDEIFDDIEGLVLKDAAKLYSPTVIEHFNSPQNFGAIEDAHANTFMSGICGDTIGIFVTMAGEKISEIGFVTNGCGPTIACASALTCMAKGKNPDEARKISSQQLIEFLGGLPIEHTHCADLAVNTLRGTLAKLP